MDEKFATELLHEVKNQTKRWFVAFCVMVGLEVATIAGFMWYISLPIDDTTITQQTDSQGDNYVVGGNYNGETNDKESETSNP